VLYYIHSLWPESNPMIDRPGVSLVAIFSLVAVLTPLALAQPGDPDADAPGTAEVTPQDLRRMGGRGAARYEAAEIEAYGRTFDRIDVEGDGGVTRDEYVENSHHATEQVRAGIFRATDRDGDGVLTRKEYIENRIITDEAKAVHQLMDADGDGQVSREEFDAGCGIEDTARARHVFEKFDGDGDGSVGMIEYLRLWGDVARIDPEWTQAPDTVNEERESAAGPPFSGPARGGPPDFDVIFERFDRNADGLLTEDELPAPLYARMRGSDSNSDGAISKEEAQAMRGRGRPGGGTADFDRGGPVGGGIDLNRRLEQAGLQIGSGIPDLSVYDADGEPVSLNELTGDKPTVLVTGCLTCPVFRRTYAYTETVAADYGPKGVRFYYVYKALAHPENLGYVRPFTLEERLMHIAEARQTLGTQVPWLCDTMDNDLKHALGNVPNGQFVFGADGKLAHMAGWADEEALRAALSELVGPIGEPTSVADLDLPDVVTRAEVGSGVVPRVNTPRDMTPVRVEPVESEDPFYVKLTAEVQRGVISGDDGKLYLGFHLDPLYHVHWNNLVDPIRYEVTTAEGVTVEPATGVGPKVDVEGDTNPRGFLIDVAGVEDGASIEMTVRYYGCSDEDGGWCRLLTQQYVIRLERDPDAGGVIGRSFRPARSGRR
jgi:Ca2+-binding EF-hand superfamily protein